MRNKLRRLVLAMLLLFLSGQYFVFAQDTPHDLKKEIEELKQGQKSMQEDLEMIKKILPQGQQKPVPHQVNVNNVEFEIGKNPTKGDDSAPLILVEFSDYQCSFCARYTKDTSPEIYENYIKTGKLRYVIIDKPLPFHKMALKAAEAAHCADEQGSFWEMHDEMMNRPDSVNDLNALAASLNLDMQKFESCIVKKKYADIVSSNLSLANKLKISGVPGFVIASGDPGNPQKVKGISFISGARPFEQFQKEIDQALASLSE
jgi:protein-disulfide isomerase